MIRALRRFANFDLGIAAALAVVALAFRVVLPYSRIVARDGIRFQDEDPWYHMRLVENLVHHFPRPLAYDPYLAHPGGQTVPVAPLFDEILAGVAWTAGLGSPSPRLIEWVGAVGPPVLAAVSVATIYFCALMLSGRFAAILAGAIAAFLPGQFLQRSVLGFTDHHVAEVLWSSLVLLFLLQAAGSTTLPRRRRSSILAGVFLAAYLLTWPSGIIVVALLGIWSVVRLKTDLDVALTAAVAALAVLLPASFAVRQLRAAVEFVVVTSLVMAAVAFGGKLLREFRPLRRFAPFVGAAAVALGAVALLRVFPALSAFLRTELGRLLPNPERETVAEAIPFLKSGAGWTPFWREFSSAGPVAAVGFLLAVRKAWRGSAKHLLIVLWSAGFLVLTLAQARFAYYLIVPVALLAASTLADLLPARPSRPGWAASAVAGALLVLVAPGLRLSIPEAGASSGPSDSWVEALTWLKANSPDPFARKDYYDALYPDLLAGGSPERSAYGVLAWWDYGYWILRIAKRVPIANPTQNGAERAAALLLEGDDDRAIAALGDAGIGYVVVDRELLLYQAASLPGPIGKFPALLVWAHERPQRYFETCLYEADGQPRRITLFYPDYFRTLVVRLELFGGRAATPSQSWVVTFREVSNSDQPRRIEEFRRFPSFEAASGFAAESPSRRQVASLSPSETCVPISSPRFLKFVHASRGRAIRLGTQDVAPVSIFQMVSAKISGD